MISKLHYISQEGKNGECHSEMIQQACEAGVRWVQLRMKNISDEKAREIALKSQAICKEFGATFILNDRVELAKEINADGVHLGLSDMSIAEARSILGNKIIGGTANTLEDVQQRIEEKVDYIGLGPFRFTSSKEKLSPTLGVEGYQTILNEVQQTAPPIIAIGGIEPKDISSLFSIGVFGIAVASIINYSENKKEIVQQLNKELK